MRERPQDQRTFDEETTMNPIRIAKNWISYRRTMNELGNLSSQTLNDIGINPLRNPQHRFALLPLIGPARSSLSNGTAWCRF